ncbi:hypothetical protein BRARA_H00209 [Brassica rapa]|uniref:Aminotransferase-like plant mobile domain-containing protein n=1 Tax=Brassica campestris TaxID=3711 RepID=A0A397Y833_BRACM|nr:hypothetical protein BRARA_H00209 [Brassica rapa]
MSSLHKTTWTQAGVFEAIMASTKGFVKNTDLLLGIAEKWCPDTNTFFFPWGEATITLEDVMFLLGFSVLGSPVFAALDESGERVKEKLVKESLRIKKDNNFVFVSQVEWMRRFMNDDDDDDELEHVAFLALWLSYFVFPSGYYHIDEVVFSVAVHVSRGTRIALAPAVLAHLYAELTLLKRHIREFITIEDKIELKGLFKLVQVWTWERFKELQPEKANPLLKGEARLSIWCDDSTQKRSSNVRKVLEEAKVESFEWRPYTKALENWEFPLFYPEEAMWVPVDAALDDEFITFARCVKVSKLVGIDCVENYFPNRVAAQFGLLQDVTCHVERKSLSKEEAWDEYNNPLDELTLYIPSRCIIPWWKKSSSEWWKKLSPEENQAVESLTPRNIIGDDDDYTSNSASSGCKRWKSMKRFYEDDEDDSLTIAQVMRLRKKDTSKVLSLSEVLKKMGDGFPKKLKRSRYIRTRRSVRSEIEKGKIGDCGGSASRGVLLDDLFDKELVKRKSECLGKKRAREEDDEICYDDITTAEMIICREKSGGDASEDETVVATREIKQEETDTRSKAANENNSLDHPLLWWKL